MSQQLGLQKDSSMLNSIQQENVSSAYNHNDASMLKNQRHALNKPESNHDIFEVAANYTEEPTQLQALATAEEPQNNNN